MRTQTRSIAAFVLMTIMVITGMIFGNQIVHAQESSQTVVDRNSNWGPLTSSTVENAKNNEEVSPPYSLSTTFEIENPEDFGSIYYQLKFNEATVIYLNGVEIASHDVHEYDYTENAIIGNETSLDSYIQEENTITDDTTGLKIQDLLREGTNVLSVETDQSSLGDANPGFEFGEFILMARDEEGSGDEDGGDEEEYANIKALTVGPGTDATELRFTWYSYTSKAGKVKLYQNGSEINTFTGTTTAVQLGLYTNKVTVTGLKGNTIYSYRVGDGDEWSKEHEIKTGNVSSFSFLLVADPQIGVKSLLTETQSWHNTVESALQEYPDVSFMVTAGDLVNTATDENQYDGYLTAPGLENLPVAQTSGNHDVAVNFVNHFNFPNHDTSLVNTASGGDYWFVYGNTLFMVLNSNTSGIKKHQPFMEQAIAANPKAKFRIAVFHHSIYSAGNHALKDTILSRRASWVPVFDELGIDFALSGHDHTYVRTHQMYNNIPVSSVKMQNGAALDPAGTVYITANSASGSKYYELLKQTFNYIATASQLETPTFSKIDITDSQLTFKTYRADTLEVVDEYSIIKTQIDTVNKPTGVALAASGKTGVKVNWTKAADALGYEVYYSTAKDGPYTKAGTATGTSFTHKPLTQGIKYYYQVRSYKTVKGKTAYSDFTSAKSLKVEVPVPTNLTAASAGATSIKLTWKKVSGATGYRIYRSTKKNGTYTKVTTLTTNKKTYTDKTVKNKKTYYYKIRAINKVGGVNKFSDYTSAVKKKITLTKPASVKAKKSGTSLKISWNSVPGAQKYRIYRKSSKKSAFKQVTTISAAKTSYKDKTVKLNKTYYYRVRAIQKVGKKNYFGTYSAVASGKVK